MLEEKLIQYKKQNRLNWSEVASELGLTRNGLRRLISTKSPKTQVITCIKIQKLTGLSPWEYLNGLDNLKDLIEK